MDFEKIKPAVEDISLSESDLEKIISSCNGKKRKFNYKPLVGIAAAAAVTVVLFAPGFLFRASSPAENDEAIEEYGDSKYDLYFKADSDSVAQNISASGTGVVDTPLFEAEGFGEIYAVIPFEFSSLVTLSDYEEWKKSVTAENGMAMLQFIEYFEISPAVFAAANDAYTKRIQSPLSDAASPFNEEIIYSFDRETIDEYYSLK